MAEFKKVNDGEMIFVLGQIVSVSFVRDCRRDDLFKWCKKVRGSGFLFWKKEYEYYQWDDGDDTICGQKFDTDEELLEYFRVYVKRNDLYVKDKVLHQKPFVKIALSDGNVLTKVFEDDRLAEMYYVSLQAEMARCNVYYRDFSKDIF